MTSHRSHAAPLDLRRSDPASISSPTLAPGARSTLTNRCRTPLNPDCTRRPTTTFAWFLAHWSKKMSWQEVARTFHITWDTVCRAVSLAVQWGAGASRADGNSGDRLWPVAHHTMLLHWLAAHASSRIASTALTCRHMTRTIPARTVPSRSIILACGLSANAHGLRTGPWSSHSSTHSSIASLKSSIACT